MKQTKEFLKQLEKLDKLIENKTAESAHWRAMAKRTTTHYGGEKVSSSGSQQKMENAIVRYMDIENEINECIDKMYDKRKEIISIIEKLSSTEYDVLHKMYVGKTIVREDGITETKYMSFDEVAEMNGKSYSWATTIHGRALKNLKRLLEENV